MFPEASPENQEWEEGFQETADSEETQESSFEAPIIEESVQDLIDEIGELQIKKGFLLSKLEKQHGQLEIVKHTQSIEPTLRNLCAQRVELYNDCVDLGRGVQRLRTIYEEIEDSVGNSKNAIPPCDSRSQIRENMASFKSHERLRKKTSRISSIVSSEAAKCRAVLRRAKVSDELQEMLILTMDELNACLESVTSTGFSLEELEAMSDVELQRVVVRDLEAQLESLRSGAQVWTQISQGSGCSDSSQNTFGAGGVDRKPSVSFNDEPVFHPVPPRTKLQKKRSLEKAFRKSLKESCTPSEVSSQNPENDDFANFPADDLPTGDFF